MSNELYYYLATDYSATGEGVTKCLMITRAYPSMEDYEQEPSFDTETMKYDPGKLKYDKEEIAKREFSDTFGGWMAHGVEVLSKDDFIEKFDDWIPQPVKNIINETDISKMPGNLKWHSTLHLNFS